MTKTNFADLIGVDAAQSTGEHDRFVVAHALRLPVVLKGLLKAAKVTRHIRTPELVVKRRRAQRGIAHDGERTGHVRRYRWRWRGVVWPMQPRDAVARDTRFRHSATPGGAFVANFTASPSGCAWPRADGGGVVVGFHLHQHMAQAGAHLISCRLGCARRAELAHRLALHYGGVVGVGHHRALRPLLVGMPNHVKQAMRLRLAVDFKAGVEYFVPTVLAVGLGEHHQLNVAWVAV